MKNKLIRFDISSFVWIIIFALAWQISSIVSQESMGLFSSPWNISKRLMRLFSEESLSAHMTSSVLLLSLSILVSVILGSATAYLSYSSKIFKSMISPFVYTINGIPVVALIPLFIIWFGFGLTSKLATVGTILLPIFHVGIFAALKSTDERYFMLGKVMNFGKLKELKYIIIPSIMPTAISLVRLSVGRAVIGVTLAELYGYGKGLGYLLNLFSISSDVSGIFSIITVLLTINFAFLWLLGILEGKFKS